MKPDGRRRSDGGARHPSTAEVSKTMGVTGLHKAAKLGKRMWGIRLLYLMLLPTVLFFIIFKYIPMYGIVISFQDFSPFRGYFGSEWVGMKHFQSILSDPYFYKLVRNTFILAVYMIIFGFPATLIFALLLNEVRVSAVKRFVQTLSFFPYFVSTAVAVGILYTLLSPQGGLVNMALQAVFDTQPIYFLSEPAYFRPLYVLLEIWKGFGYGAIVFLAAMAALDPHLYEAAEIDGAGRWRKMWHITLPGISNTIIILLILSIGNILSVNLDTILLMYNPRLYETADVIQTFVYRRAFPEEGLPNYSYATAVGLFQSVVALILIVFANRMAKKYSDSYLF